MSLVHLPHASGSDCFDEIKHLAPGYAVASDGVGVDGDAKRWLAGDLVD